MGFNISVQGVKDRDNQDCFEFIDRSYYVFTASLGLFGGNSVLIKSGKYFELDLEPLGNHMYLESEFDSKLTEERYFENAKVDIASILPVLELFLESVKKEPTFLKNVTFDYKENIQQKESFEEYTASSDFIWDLTSVINAILCHQKNGETNIYFLAL